MRLRRRGTVASLVLAAAAMAGCGGGGADSVAPVPASTFNAVSEVLSEVLSAAGVSRVKPAKDAPVSEVVAGMNSFAAELYRVASAGDKAEDNLVFSPLSIAYAFAMVRAGAGGQTAAQIDEAFGFPAGTAEAFNALTRQLVSDAAPVPKVTPTPSEWDPPRSEPVLTIANGLFTQGGYNYRPDFLRTLTEHYGSELRTLDFAQADDAVAAVNRWVSENTAGRIPVLFDKLDPATRFVLANTVFLDADWKIPFGPAGREKFAVDSTPTPVPMITRETTFGYATGKGWRAVELPYFGDRLAMRVLLPTGDGTPAEVLTPAVLAAAARTKPTYVEVTMPKWDFGTDLDLPDLLRELGVRDVFDDSAADLSGITESEALFVYAALHKANITVDELGTVASAATGIAGMPTSLPPTPVEFLVDRPFAFTIVDTKTGAPIFLGQVTDPRG